MLLSEHGNHFFEHLWRVNLLLMCSERGHANPLLESFFGANLGRKNPDVAALRREDGCEIQLHGIAQFSKHIGIVLKSRWQRLHHLMRRSH